MNKELLKKYYGYDNFRGNQEDIINSIVNKKDTLAILATGGGKSVCFQIPALRSSGLTIVISPLISLMEDQVYELKGMGINARCLNSNLDKEEISNIYAHLKNIKLLYVSPERLTNKMFLDALENIVISNIIIDEAHCISQWGHDFRKSYMNINKFRKYFSYHITVAAFTATATKHVVSDMLSNLKLDKPNIFTSTLERSNLIFDCVHVSNKIALLRHYLSFDGVKIIYCSTVKNVEYIYNLFKEKHNITYYHGKLNKEDRFKNQNDFIKGKVDLIVATSAFGMGINKKNVRYVIHYESPSNLEDYYQEAGRAGRDGFISRCILLYSKGDLKVHKFLNEESFKDTKDKKQFNLKYKRLKYMSKYIHNLKCSSKFISNYFNSKVNVCGICKNCVSKNKEVILKDNDLVDCDEFKLTSVRSFYLSEIKQQNNIKNNYLLNKFRLPK